VKERTVDLPALCVRAEIASFNEEKRTVDVVFSTGAGVERMDWFTGKRYIEQLEISREAIQLDRLNSGAPLLDSHSSWSVRDQLGAVVPGSARIENGKATATIKFSARDAVAPIVRDVKDGIVTAVSVGYRVSRYEETSAKDQELPIRTAKRWTPYEVSLVSMPADVGAKVRSGDKTDTNQCVISAVRDVTEEIDLNLQRRRLALSA
jgi:hypothetical protein